LQSIPGKQKPALVLRTDVANVYGPSLLSTSFSLMLEDCVLLCEIIAFFNFNVFLYDLFRLLALHFIKNI